MRAPLALFVLSLPSLANAQRSAIGPTIHLATAPLQAKLGTLPGLPPSVLRRSQKIEALATRTLLEAVDRGQRFAIEFGPADHRAGAAPTQYAGTEREQVLERPARRDQIVLDGSTAAVSGIDKNEPKRSQTRYLTLVSPGAKAPDGRSLPRGSWAVRSVTHGGAHHYLVVNEAKPVIVKLTRAQYESYRWAD